MAKYFTIDELVRSETAARRGIDNTPPAEAVTRLEALAEKLLDPVRELWGAPLIVNSGYRCPELNAAVGGAARSGHMRGEAADITTGSRKDNRLLFKMICSETDTGENADESANRGAGGSVDNRPEFDQLIDECGYSWLHVSYRAEANRRQILHL